MSALLALGLSGSVVLRAEEPISPLLDRYAFTLGSYFTAVDTNVQANETNRSVGDRVDFESDIGFKESDELFRAEAQLLFKRRHQLNLAYYELRRAAARVVEREIQWRDRLFPVNVEVAGFFNTDIAEISYTYWIVGREKFVFGVNAGVQAVAFDIGVGLRLEGREGSIDPDVSITAPVPLIGLELRRRMTDKLMFRGLARAITFSDIDEISKVVAWDLSLQFEHRTFKNGGIGIAYKALRFDIDFEKRFVGGDIRYGLDGFEVFLRFWS